MTLMSLSFQILQAVLCQYAFWQRAKYNVFTASLIKSAFPLKTWSFLCDSEPFNGSVHISCYLFVSSTVIGMTPLLKQWASSESLHHNLTIYAQHQLFALLKTTTLSWLLSFALCMLLNWVHTFLLLTTCQQLCNTITAKWVESVNKGWFLVWV